MKAKKNFLFILLVFLLMTVFFKSPAVGQGNYLEVSVKQGDTLWTIAKKYNDKGQDIRKVIYDIKKINNLKTGDIIPGQVLLIPE